MNRTSQLITASAIVGLVCGSLAAVADTASGDTSGVTGPLSYLHLYAGSDGESHFEEKNFTFSSAADTGQGRRPSVYRFEGFEGATLMRLRQGAVETWHRAPRRNFVFVVQGQVDVTASDGEVRRLTPGTIMLMDDTTGKGHETRHVGEREHIVLTIPATPD